MPQDLGGTEDFLSGGCRGQGGPLCPCHPPASQAPGLPSRLALDCPQLAWEEASGNRIHNSVPKRLPGGLSLGPRLDPAASSFKRNLGRCQLLGSPTAPAPSP